MRCVSVIVVSLLSSSLGGISVIEFFHLGPIWNKALSRGWHTSSQRASHEQLSRAVARHAGSVTVSQQSQKRVCGLQKQLLDCANHALCFAV